MPMGYSFPKTEKLCGQLRISRLYEKGKHFTCYPLRITYLAVIEQEESVRPGVRILLWAPKSLFKHAVDRNRLRRLMREAYRHNASVLRALCEEQNMSLHVAFNYIAKEPLTYGEIEKATQKAIYKLQKANLWNE